MNLFRKIKTVYNIIFDKTYRVSYLSQKGKYNHLADEEYLRLRYETIFKRKLNLDNPQYYTEKLQWLKLYDRRPIYSILVDKYEVKKIVSDLIGEKYIIPTLGVWNNFEDIDFDLLPNKFVLKCTHDSGGLVICTDKAKFDYKKAKEKIEKSLKNNYFYLAREWPYKNVEPRIIAEEFMEDEETKELRDYKFFCFNGETKALFIATERQNPNEDTKFDFFDENFNHLPFTNGHECAKVQPAKPKCFDEMKNIANKLSKGYPHMRVDLYEVNGNVYFGEITLSHWGGFVPFNPEEWDLKFGSWLKLPGKYFEE